MELNITENQVTKPKKIFSEGIGWGTVESLPAVLHFLSSTVCLSLAEMLTSRSKQSTPPFLTNRRVKDQ